MKYDKHAVVRVARFEEDINWIERNKVNHSSRITPIVVIAIALALVASLFVVTDSFAADGSTALDRPDWQRNNNVQNIYENIQAWSDYTGDIDAEFFDTDDTNYATQLVGEAYSVSMEFLIHLDQFAPSGNCAFDFWYAGQRQAQVWANLYGALYYNLTAEVGEPIDWEPLFETANDTSEYAVNLISEKCWNKLDT